MTLPEVHPDAADGRCAVTLLHRQRMGGQLFKVGEVLTIRGAGRVRVAAHLIRTGQAKPADERTRRDVAVYLALADAWITTPSTASPSRRTPQRVPP